MSQDTGTAFCSQGLQEGTKDGAFTATALGQLDPINAVFSRFEHCSKFLFRPYFNRHSCGEGEWHIAYPLLTTSLFNSAADLLGLSFQGTGQVEHKLIPAKAGDKISVTAGVL
jgi:hypothetical protein